ncbi:MAG TPA: hypothetical protein HPP95_12760, partial [Deltaproteobacteria bacterium]|nr:hypothetical protein [Deltaproteobacteria bacterium]
MQPQTTANLLDRLLNISATHALLLLSALIVISYSNTLYSPFVLDDRHTFIDEPAVYIDKISLSSIEKLRNSRFGKNRIIPMATFAANHYLYQLTNSYAQYHLTNIFIHILATFCLAYLVKGLLSTPVGKQTLKSFPPNHFIFFVCALWALNPIQTNAVTYIVQRMASLVTLFYFATVALYIQARLSNTIRHKTIYYAGAGITACCAFFSKENSATLPMAILSIEWMFLSPGSFKTMLYKLGWRRWVFLSIAVILFLPLAEPHWRSLMSGYDIRSFSLTERLLTETRVIVYYLSLLIFPLPSRLNLDHDFTLSTSLISPPTTIFAIITLVALIGYAIKLRHKYPLFTFGIFWFFINMLIESTVVPLELIFEHRLYLPSAGVILAIFGILDVATSYLNHQYQKDSVYQGTILLLTIILCLSSILTTLRNNDWRDIYTIHKDIYEKSPNKPRALSTYGLTLGNMQQFDKAIEILQKCIDKNKRGNEDYVNATNNILVAYIQKENAKKGIEVTSKNIKNMPHDCNIIGLPVLFYNLAVALVTEGRYLDAVDSQISAIKFMEKINNGNVDIMSVKNLEHFVQLAYKDEKSRQILNLCQFGMGKDVAVQLYMTKMLLDLRLYNFAKDYLEYVEHNKLQNTTYTELLKRLHTEQRENELMSAQYDFTKHRTIHKSKYYRYYMYTA